jgi:NTP pyrophosphatase (non-canonical NTP hydrolase)
MKEIEKKIKKYLADRSWDNALPGNLAKSVVLEAAELLELFQWSNPSFEELKKDKHKFEDFKKELADVLIYCLDLSTLAGIDTKKIIIEKLTYNERKFPVKVVRGNSKGYYAIKKTYRKKGF